MKHKKDNRKNTEIDAVLRDALGAYCDAEAASIPPRAQLEARYAFSEQHDRRMTAMFAQTAQAPTPRRPRRFRAKYLYAAAALAVVILSAPLLLRLTADPQDMPGNEDERWEVQYMLPGFELQNTVVTDSVRELVYQNSAGQIISVTGEPYEAAGSSATAVIGSRSIVIDGVEYTQIFSVDGAPCSMLIWSDSGQKFQVAADAEVPADALLQIALSVKSTGG